MSTLITGISELRTVSELGTIKDAAMLIDDGVVTWVGPANEAPAEAAKAGPRARAVLTRIGAPRVHLARRPARA